MTLPLTSGITNCPCRYFLVGLFLFSFAPLLIGQNYLSVKITVNAMDVQQLKLGQKSYRCDLSRLPVIKHQQAIDADHYGPLRREPLILFQQIRNTVSISLNGIAGNWAYRRLIADLQMDGEKIPSVAILNDKITFQLAARSLTNIRSVLSIMLFIPEQDRSICFNIPVLWEEVMETETFALRNQPPAPAPTPMDYSPYRLRSRTSESLISSPPTHSERRRPGKKMIEQSIPLNARSAIPQGYAYGVMTGADRYQPDFVGPMPDNYGQTNRNIPQTYSSSAGPYTTLAQSATTTAGSYQSAGVTGPVASAYSTWGATKDSEHRRSYRIPY